MNKQVRKGSPESIFGCYENLAEHLTKLSQMGIQ